MSNGPTVKRHRSKQDYSTPDDFMQAVRGRFGPIGFDLAAHAQNAKCMHYFTEEQNSLLQQWNTIRCSFNGWLWLNPPFDNIEPWAKKCAEEMALGARILFLTPASIGSNWFARHVNGKAVVLSLQGRMSFDGIAPYPKDCMLSVFAHGLHGFNVWKWGAA